MKLPKASTTSRIWVSLLLRTTSLDAFRMARGKWRERSSWRDHIVGDWSVCTLLSASPLYYIMNGPFSIPFHSVSLLSCHGHTCKLKPQLCVAQRLSSFSSFLTSFMMIDQYSPQQLGSSVGKPIKSFHPSIKQQGEGNIPNTTPCCLFLPPENRLVWQSAGGSPLHRGNLSVNVKIINKTHIVIVTVLSAVIQHGNHSSGSADSVLLDAERPGGPLHCLLKCSYWTCWVVQGNIVSSSVYDKVTWIIKGDENFITSIHEQCGLGTFGSNNKDSGGLNQYSNSHYYSSARTFLPFLATSIVRRYNLFDFRPGWIDCLTETLQLIQA